MAVQPSGYKFSHMNAAPSLLICVLAGQMTYAAKPQKGIIVSKKKKKE